MTYVGEPGWELTVPGRATRPTVYDGAVRRRGRRRRLQRAGVAAAREGLPRVRSRAHPRLHAGRGGAGVRHRAQGRQGLPRSVGPRGAPRPARRGRATPPAGLVRARGPRGDAVGRRAAAARRRSRPGRSPVRPGEPRSAPRSGSPTCAPTGRSPRTRSPGRGSRSTSPAHPRRRARVSLSARPGLTRRAYPERWWGSLGPPGTGPSSGTHAVACAAGARAPPSLRSTSWA